MIRIELLAYQELLRTGLRALAERDGDIEVVGEAADGRAGLARVRELRPDLVLMDLRMPLLDGIAATARITADPTLDEVRVVVLTTFDEYEDVIAAIMAGAAGLQLKDVAPAALREAVPVVAGRGALLCPALAPTLLARRRPAHPIPRQNP